MSRISINSNTNDVLCLLLFVITADSKVYQEEIDSFRDVALGMKLEDREGHALTDPWLLDWFLQNYEAVHKEAGLPEADSKLVYLFIRLEDWPHKSQLLDALRSVAASDGQYHLNEKVLIALAAAYWDMNSPQMN